MTVTAAEDDDAANETETLTHTATGGGYGSATKNVTVNVTDNDTAPIDLAPSFGDATIADQTWVEDAAIATLTLPDATGGDPPLTYALAPALPDGLTYDPANRTISGTPATPAPAAHYTWTATDGDAENPESASLTFTITITSRPRPVRVDRYPGFGGATIADQTWVENAAIATLTLPEGTGGDGQLTYALEPALPAGVDFDATTRRISGTPREKQAATTYAYTVTDGDAVDPDVAWLTFTITVIEDLRPSFGGATIADQTWLENAAIATLTLPEATGGDGQLTYTLEPALPAGVDYNATTRRISGTPREKQAATTYTYTATDDDAVDPDVARLTFTITVIEDLLPSFGNAAVPNQRYTQNLPIAPLTLPEATGGDGQLTYALAPATPDGLTYDPANRTISGTPTTPAPAEECVYTATDGDAVDPDVATLTFTITIMEDLRPSFEDAAVPNQRFTQNLPTEPLTLPEATGGDGQLTYTLEPALPDGLTFDPSNRTISGTPATPAPAAEYTYTVTDGDAVDPDRRQADLHHHGHRRPAARLRQRRRPEPALHAESADRTADAARSHRRRPAADLRD